MAAYYNEHDPYASAWLQNLERENLIANGRIDARDLQELTPADLVATQCHFFAGIGGWSHALRLAGWPDDLPVWTGSCPCQPFSSAGRGRGFDDARHLWPVWFRLIEQCRPPVIFGEQVAGAAGLKWFDSVSHDLERAGYAVAAADLAAASVGAPHKRQRLYFVAYRVREGFQGRGPTEPPGRLESAGGGGFGAIGLPHAHDQERAIHIHERGPHPASAPALGCGPAGGFWTNAEWLPFADGKTRPVESGSFPLAHGVPNRVGKIRGYGNAICPPLAAEFIRAARDAIGI